jgi:hypothetical protein
LDCGKRYQNRKYTSLKSLIDAMFSRFPKLEVAMWTLTIPHDAIGQHIDNHDGYNALLKTSARFIESIFPGCASIHVLHNWSSSDPLQCHLHVHIIVFCINSKKQHFSAFRPVEPLTVQWQKSINSLQIPVINLQYATSRNIAELYHYTKYICRSPITDYHKAYSAQLSEAYLLRVSKLHGVHRFRNCGWLANWCKNDTLLHFNIVQSSTPQDDTWKLYKRYRGTYIVEYDRYIFDNDFSLASKDIDYSDSTASIPKYRHIHSPPIAEDVPLPKPIMPAYDKYPTLR